MVADKYRHTERGRQQTPPHTAADLSWSRCWGRFSKIPPRAIQEQTFKQP